MVSRSIQVEVVDHLSFSGGLNGSTVATMSFLGRLPS